MALIFCDGGVRGALDLFSLGVMRVTSAKNVWMAWAFGQVSRVARVLGRGVSGDHAVVRWLLGLVNVRFRFLF